MNRLLKNKFFPVGLVTFTVTTAYLAFGFYRVLWPYQEWFKPVSMIYALSLLVFTALVGLSNLYSVTAFILARRRKKSVSQWVAVGPAISFTILLGFAMAPLMPKFLPSGSYLKPFNSETWIHDNATMMMGGITERQKMLGDVIENILPGKTRNEIIRLLGLSSDDSNQKALLYYLGPARGDFFGLEVEWLIIELDAGGHYQNFSLFRED